MPWDSKTKAFDEQDMYLLEMGSPEMLAIAMKAVPPLKALQAMAELLFNNDQGRLFGLLLDDELTEHWKASADSTEKTDDDLRYLRKLIEREKAVKERVAKGVWESKTDQWRAFEMIMLEDYAHDPILPAMLKQFDPVVALRAIAEYMEHGQDDVVTTLLKDEELVAHTAKYKADMEATSRDRWYAFQLSEKLKKMT